MCCIHASVHTVDGCAFVHVGWGDGRVMRHEDVMGVYAAMVESEFNLTEGLEARATVKVGDVAVQGDVGLIELSASSSVCGWANAYVTDSGVGRLACLMRLRCLPSQMVDHHGREVPCLSRTRIHWMKTSFIVTMAFIPRNPLDFEVRRRVGPVIIPACAVPASHRFESHTTT